MIRKANFGDIQAIVLLLQEGYARTHYARAGHVKIDIGVTKSLLMQSINRHGHIGVGGCWVQVAENEGEITGLILGTLQRVYSIGDMLMATDLFWTCNSGSKITDARDLMRGMIEWAWSSEHVAEVKCGTTAIINGDVGAPGRILERLGLKFYGQIYRADRPVVISQEAVA